jgi:hypothetical protein
MLPLSVAPLKKVIVMPHWGSRSLFALELDDIVRDITFSFHFFPTGEFSAGAGISVNSSQNPSGSFA